MWDIRVEQLADLLSRYPGLSRAERYRAAKECKDRLTAQIATDLEQLRPKGHALGDHVAAHTLDDVLRIVRGEN